MKCSFCNQEIVDNAEFCPDCGKNISKPLPCPSCGIEIIHGKRFCHKCGKEVFEKTEEKPFYKSGKGKIYIIAVISLVLIIIFYILAADFLKKREEHQLEFCEFNMKSIATALAMYATDNGENYPPSLDHCVKYFQEVNLPLPPLCPSCKKPYIYQKTDDMFIIKCGGENAHIKTEKVDEGHYPVYIRQQGIILKGDYLSYLEPTPPPITPTPAVEGQSELDICEANLKKISAALDLYASDNAGLYPPTLEYLTEGINTKSPYMQHIPACPACSQPYIYQTHSKPENFTLMCGGENVHVSTGKVGQGHYPLYSRINNLVLKEEVSENTSSTPVTEPNQVSSEKIPQDLLTFIKENYNALENKDFKKAYNFKSSEWKKKNTCDDYCSYWKDNITIKLIKSEILSQSDKEGKAKIRYYTEDKNAKNGKTDKGYYNGVINLIKEDGDWKIKDLKFEKE